MCCVLLYSHSHILEKSMEHVLCSTEFMFVRLSPVVRVGWHTLRRVVIVVWLIHHAYHITKSSTSLNNLYTERLEC